MGTNYYMRTNICECCKRYDETHIGKNSYGWTFSFHATDEIRSWKQWKKRLSMSDAFIYDEYGDYIDFNDFCDLVESKKKEKNNHTIYCQRQREYSQRNFLDEEGNSFSEGEFF